MGQFSRILGGRQIKGKARERYSVPLEERGVTREKGGEGPWTKGTFKLNQET